MGEESVGRGEGWRDERWERRVSGGGKGERRVSGGGKGGEMRESVERGKGGEMGDESFERGKGGRGECRDGR